MATRKHKRLGINMSGFLTCHEDMAAMVKAGFLPAYGQISNKRMAPTTRSIEVFQQNTRAMVGLFIHAPFWINLIRPTDHLKSLSRIEACIDVQRGFSFCHGVVTHVGALGSVSTKKDPITENLAHETLVKSLLWLNAHIGNSDLDVLVENTAGTRTGWPYGSMDQIVTAVLDARSRGANRVKMCLDTCHAIADGETPEKILKTISELGDSLGLIHMNPANKDVYPGSHLDRHSYDKLRDSVHIEPELLKEIFEKTTCPSILERKSIPIMVDDYNFLLGE